MKKQKPRKKPKPRALSKAETFYVERHFGQMTPAKIAEEIGAPHESVEAYIKSLRDAGSKPPGQPLACSEGRFTFHNGTVSMTPQASETGDKFREVTVDGPKPNYEFLKRRGGGMHIIDPNRPVLGC